MKRLIVLNPIIELLLGNRYKELVDYLEARGWHVDNPKSGISIVRQAYAEYLRKTLRRPIVDSRCPEVLQMVQDEFPYLAKHLAPIEPILITGARLALVRSQSETQEDVELVVVSPCKAFSSFERPDLKIITWSAFKEEQGLSFPEEHPEVSPIPLGFFSSLGVRIYNASGEGSIRHLLHNIPPDADLLELLWCEGGCHKGDGL